MLVQIGVFVVCAVVGFVASKRLRRPEKTAQAASLARTVGGSLGGRRNLDAPELQRACFSEMVRHVRVNREGRTNAPARYRLRVNPADMAVIEESRAWFTNGLTDALRQAARDNGWSLDGTIKIDFERDPSRRPGVPSALAVAPGNPPEVEPSADPPPAPRTAATGTGSRPLSLVREDTDRTYALGGTTVTIGRAKDRTITIDDNRVSRSHARIERHQNGWVIIDEGSSNGTRISGRSLGRGETHLLRPGDMIGVGPAQLRVVAGQGSSDGGEPGTRALDDYDRNRISAEVLGLPRADDK